MTENKENKVRIAIDPEKEGMYVLSLKSGDIKFVPWTGRRISHPYNDPKVVIVKRVYLNISLAERAIEMWKEHHFHNQEATPHPFTAGVKYHTGLSPLHREADENPEFFRFKYITLIYLDEKGGLSILRDDVLSQRVREGDNNYPSKKVLKRLYL